MRAIDGPFWKHGGGLEALDQVLDEERRGSRLLFVPPLRIYGGHQVDTVRVQLRKRIIQVAHDVDAAVLSDPHSLIYRPRKVLPYCW